MNRRKKSDKRHAIRAAVESLEGRMLLSRYGEVFTVDDAEFTRGAVEYAADGTAVVVYSAGLSIDPLYFRKMGSDGTLIGDRITLSASEYDCGVPDAAIAEDGSLVVTWDESLQYTNYRVALQRFSLSGEALGSKVRVDTGEGSSPVVAASPDGGFAVAYLIGSQSDLAVRVYDEAGNPLGQAISMGVGSAITNNAPSIAYTPDGNIIVAWGTSSWPYGIHYRVLDGAGTPIGDTQTIGDGHLTSVSVAKDGTWAIAWTGSAGGVQMLRFDAASNPIGEAVRVDAGMPAGAYPQIAHLPDGGIVVGWCGGDFDYVRRYAADGQPIGTAMAIGPVDSLSQMAPRLAIDSDGEYMVLWRSSSVGSNYLAGMRFGPGTDLRPIFEKSFTLAEGGQVGLWANADFILGQTITAWEWDYNYDGKTFQVDATGIAPAFGGAGIDGPATRTIGVRVRADDGSVSNIATTTVTITNVAPVAKFAAGPALEPGDSGTVSFASATDASKADRDAGFVYSYDFNNDGTYEVSGSRSSTATVPASYLSGVGNYTIRGQISDKNGGSRIYTAQLTVADIVQQAFTVAEGGQVTLSANGDFMPGQTITAWEWDYNYDGNTFTADATGRQPIFSAANIDGPATANVAVRAKNSSTILAFATTTVRVTNVAPTATFSAGGTVEPGSAGTVSFSNATDASLADRNAGFTFSYDFNNDGTFEITSSRASTATVPAGYLTNIGSYTIRGRITDKNGGSRSYTTTLRVASVPPTALFSIGGSVTLGAAGSVSFTQVHDSPGDLAAGFTYSYDLNNDGTYEVTGISPVAQVPASTLVTIGNHTVRGRIADRFGAANEYSAQIPVTIPPDYFPTTPGLTWSYSGTDDDEPWNSVVTSKTDVLNGEQCFVLESRQRAGTEDHVDNSYYRFEGAAVGQFFERGDYPKYTTDLLIDPPAISSIYSEPVGWSNSWRGATVSGTYRTLVAGTAFLTLSGSYDTVQSVLRVEPVELSNGVRFSEAFVVQEDETVRLHYVGTDFTEDATITAKTTKWYVRGLGLVKNQDIVEKNWTADDGSHGIDYENDHYELTAIPEWAKYTTLTNGVLQINGTEISDDIRFEAGATDITVYRNGLPETVPYAGLTGIVINGLDGDDRIDLSALSFPATITGGAGNDTITGGTGADLIYGGDGDDVLSAGAGSDTIYGNFGNDVIMGGLQRDSIMGGWGDDTITAGEGPDSVYGGNGRDLIRGGKGADYVEGKGKSDTIYGGVGNDTIHGNAGDDLIYAEDGDDRVFVNDGESLVFRDTVYAGAGADVIDRDALDSVLDDEVEVLA